MYENIEDLYPPGYDFDTETVHYRERTPGDPFYKARQRKAVRELGDSERRSAKKTDVILVLTHVNNFYAVGVDRLKVAGPEETKRIVGLLSDPKNLQLIEAGRAPLAILGPAKVAQPESQPDEPDDAKKGN